MIYRLQKRFILVCVVSVFSVIVLVFGLMAAFNIHSMNSTLDTLADLVSQGSGRFLDFFDGKKFPNMTRPIQSTNKFNFITPETRFSTRHFTVWFDENGGVSKTNTESIFSVTEEHAVKYAEKAVKSGKSRGWIDDYRYKVYTDSGANAVVFINGAMNKATLLRTLVISAFVLLGCAVLVLLMTILLSRRVVKPVAEAHKKQKQFITDANHELKTPLTLILANLDLAEFELGKNEWLDDIRTEGQRMTELVGQLTALSRIDEGEQRFETSELPLSDILSDTVSDFKGLAGERGKSLISDIEADIVCSGNEAMLRRMISVLMDNALKYCDEGGEIRVELKKKRCTVLTVENSYRDVDSVDLDKLFDRFYRADKARTYAGGYGIGLSIAKAAAEKHHGEITAYKRDPEHIGFKVKLK